MTIRNHRSPEGAQLGQIMARFCDEAEPKARLRCPELPPRCASCAFREGRHLANQSPATQMDALKCVIEGREFLCHEPGRDEAPCAGWTMLMLAKDDDDFATAPWDFIGGGVDARR